MILTGKLSYCCYILQDYIYFVETDEETDFFRYFCRFFILKG
jgi:hypothetical protein